nr:putative cytochrome p450 4d14 [Quercus suber]
MLLQLVTNTYDFEKPKKVRDFLRNILGDGLIIVEGDDHKFLRKNCMPSFSFRHIKDLYPIFWDKSTQLVEGVARQVAEKSAGDADGKTGVVEVNHWANMVTMDIIGMAAMGRDFRTLRSGQDPLIENYEELLEPTREKQLYFAANIIGPSNIIRRLPWKMNEASKRIETNLARICVELVQQKKAAMKTDSDADAHKDILSLLIRTNNFSDRQLADQLLTFLAAGHETTSSAFTWTTYLLSRHPEIQTALRKEIHAHVPSPTAPLAADFDLATVLESLPLLNGVCNETLRLYPTVPITIRNVVRPTTLVGHALPVGIQVLLSPWAINRSPKLWGADADRFVPDRWIDTDAATGERKPNNAGGAPSNYANLTFLHGPRSCIGQGFAKAELRALVAAFVGSFQMDLADPNEDVVPSGVVTTKPKNGMNLRLKYLGGW